MGAIVREQGWRGTDNAMQVGVCKLNQQRGRGAQGKKREGTVSKVGAICSGCFFGGSGCRIDAFSLK